MAVPPGSRWRVRAAAFLPLATGVAAFATLPLAARAQDAVGAVAGRVTEAGSGAPITGASVRVLTLSTREVAGAANSGEDGRFRVGGLRPGAYAVSVSRIG